MWYKGYFHYHTSFRYPSDQRVTPEVLVEDLRKAGVSFAFCAGDHGDIEGNNYWGVNVEEFIDYKDACISASKEDTVLIPAPETHLMFPPFNERHEHHSCVPILNYLPKLELPESRALAASYTKKVREFISECHNHDISLTLNHPYLSVISPFSGPPPLSVSCLAEIDYLELFTLDNLRYTPHNLSIYIMFLCLPKAAKMACCAGVDNAEYPWLLPSITTKILPVTYLYIPGRLSTDSVIEAYNERKSFAAYGNLCLEEIRPVPSKRLIKNKKPAIQLAVKSTDKTKITHLEIYRNGRKIYDKAGIDKNKYSLTWEDKEPLKGENHYILHIEGDNAHLVTSPISYSF